VTEEPTVKVELELPAHIYASLDVWADLVLDEPIEAVLEVLAYEMATNDELKMAAAHLMVRKTDVQTGDQDVSDQGA
jgi:hypothetical protein